MIDYKVGDWVVIDFNNTLNKDLANHKKDGVVNDIVYNVTRVTEGFVDVDTPVLKGQETGKGWMIYRFKLAKPHIINKILSEI